MAQNGNERGRQMDPELRTIMERVDQVEEQSFISLYKDAPAELNAGVHDDDGVHVVWLGSYANSGFSAISIVDESSNLDAAIERTLTMLKERGVRVIGMEDHPDLPSHFNRDWFAARGFQPDYEEQIWWLPLERFSPPDEMPPGVRIEQIEAGDAGTFAAILNEGFDTYPDTGLGRAFAAVIGKTGWHHYIAYVDDEPGAAAALFIDDRVADCFVAATRPAARRRGAQTALINHRLVDGRAAGCDIATAQSVTYNASLRNFERRGFRPIYRRMIYARGLEDSE
jgi:ribosomal protein S18 acetylase RimI-like enzyme